MPLKAIQRHWRERQSAGSWSATEYNGLFLPKHEILIADLPHGMRVVRYDNSDNFQFTSVVSLVTEVSEDFVAAAKRALEEDERFQMQRSHFLEAMKNSRPDS